MKEKKSGAAAEAEQKGPQQKRGKWSDAAVRVLNERYVMKDEHGKPTETPDDLIWRVAWAVASAEDRWADKSGRTSAQMAQAFYDLMAERLFLPNSPTLMNAGKGNNLQLSACYVVPVEDSLAGIFDGIKNAALIHQSGGGCISGDAHVFTTFCGVESIATLYERVRATGKQEEVSGGHATMDVRDLNIQTMALNPENGSYEPAHVTHLWRYDVPLADQVRVRAANGLEVTTSRWHPFMVFDGARFVERRADELRAGDILPTSNASVRQRWPHSAYKEVAGICLDEEIAWLLGYYLGDGSLGWAKVPESEPRREKLRWRLFDGRTASLTHASDILARRFGVSVNVQQDARGLYSLTTSNATFISVFRCLLDVQPGPKLELPFPEMIAKSPLTVVGAFLAGLVDSDGHVEASRDRVTFTTQSHYLASKVHTLCSLLGFAPAIRSRQPYGKGRSVVYEVKLAGEPFIADLRELIGPYLNDTLKSSRLAAMARAHEHSTAPRLPIPFSAIEDMLHSIGVTTNTTEIYRQPVRLGQTEIWLHRWKEGLGVSMEKLLQVVTALRPLVAAHDQARLEVLEHLARGATTVEAVEAPQENQPFYDFTVAGHSTYLAGTNGLTAIHNTGFSFSRLRPQGSAVSTTHGVASGPVSFMRIFDQATEAVKQGGCVVPETRVATTRGLMQIGSLGPKEADEKSWHPHAQPVTVYTDEGQRRSEEFYYNGMSVVRRLRTKHGYQFTGTLEHRVRVIDQESQYSWRCLKDVQVGDWVALQKNTLPEVTDYYFTPQERIPHFNANKIRTPEQPTAELGEFIGYFIGDGCINFYNPGMSTGRLIFTIAHAEPEVGARLLDLAKELFAVTAITRTKPNDASTNYFFNSTELVAWLEHIGVSKPSTLHIRVPEIAFQAGAKFARGFLRGLFTADGTITTEGYPSLCSISRGLMEDVQQLLLALGIPSHIEVSPHRDNAFGRNPLYRLYVITREGLHGFARQIGFMSPTKNARLETSLQKAWELNDVIPNQQALVASLYAGPGRGSGPGRSSRGANRTLYRDTQHCLPDVAASRQLTRSRLQTLAEKHEEIRISPLAAFLTNNQFYDQVASIEEDKAVTVDLSVEENHTYIANGFVSHNTRRGANMGILRVDHPDILQFIDCKRDGSITNFNISVAITDEFMRALEANDEYDLVAPHTKQVVGKLRAREVMDRIVSAAWATGDPGLVFIDRANRSTANPTPEIELLESTNPCGEQFLGPYDACNLGSVNLGLFVKDGKVDYEALEETTRLCTRFLDDVIEINPFPLPQVREKVYANRRIGLGVMGWAEMLFELNIRYDSEEAIKLGEELMRFIERISTDESRKLAEERGAFPNFPRSIYKDGPELRNSTRTTVAPTGSISILADCSSGIEPIFALAFQHRVKQPDGSYRVLDFVNPFFQRAVEESNMPDKEGILIYVKEHGALHGHPLATHPALQRFVTAHEIAPDWHIRMQAAFQKGVDNSISKCLVAGTLVPTSKGLMAIEDFSDVEEPDTFVNIAEEGITVGGHRVLSHYYAGEKLATRIRLDNGAELIGSTESHRVSTPDGWKRLADLRMGDLVIGRFAASHGAGGAVLPPGGIYRTSAKLVTFPERMTPKLAQFLGMLAADGHTTIETGAVGLTSADEEVLAEFTMLARDLFGLAPRHTIEARNSNVEYLTLNSRALCRWIEGLNGKGAYYKRVPVQILCGSAEEKLAFLRGVSLDGYYRPKHGLYIYGGMSKSLAYGIAEVCRSFGLPLVRQEQVTVAYSGNVAYKVVVSNELQELVQCMEPHKNGPVHHATYQVLIDHEVVSQTSLPSSHPFYSAWRSIRQRQPQNRDNRTAERLGWSSDMPVFRVTAVEDAGVKSLYDIEVEDAHEYVVNGLVSHNTINLPNSATLEDVEQAYMLAWNLGCLGITIFRDGSKGEQVLNVGVKESDKTRQVKTTAGEITAPRATAESEPEVETIEAAQYEMSRTPRIYGGDGAGVTGGIKRRPPVVYGYTRQIRAPEGKANITLNSDADGLLEVFVNVGKAGSDIAGLAEALGRLISLHLRIASPLSPAERAREIIDQLRGIGGSRAVGFGPEQIRSLPDAVARALELHLEGQFEPQPPSISAPQATTLEAPQRIIEAEQEGEVSASQANGTANGAGGGLLLPHGPLASYRVTGNLCLQCGCNTLVYEEGCKKCYSCGYSEC